MIPKSPSAKTVRQRQARQPAVSNKRPRARPSPPKTQRPPGMTAIPRRKLSRAPAARRCQWNPHKPTKAQRPRVTSQSEAPNEQKDGEDSPDGDNPPVQTPASTTVGQNGGQPKTPI
jgi:hypothetical protein